MAVVSHSRVYAAIEPSELQGIARGVVGSGGLHFDAAFVCPERTAAARLGLLNTGRRGEQFALVAVLAGIREANSASAGRAFPSSNLFEMRGIDIAEGHDLHLRVAGQPAHGAAAHAGDADAGDLEQEIWRLAPSDGGEAQNGGCGSRLGEEMTAIHGCRREG